MALVYLIVKCEMYISRLMVSSWRGKFWMIFFYYYYYFVLLGLSVIHVFHMCFLKVHFI